MRELLRCHAVSYAEGIRMALQAQGIRSAIIDEGMPSYLGFAGRVRLVVDESDFETALVVVRALEAPSVPSRKKAPPSWKRQRWGLALAVLGFLMLGGGAGLTMDGPELLIWVVLSLSFLIMVGGTTIIFLASRDDREEPQGAPDGAPGPSP